MYIITSVRDRKTEEFRGLYLSRTAEAATRMFLDAILSGEDTVIRQHPEDFYLAQVGFFDEDTGECSGMNNADLHRNLIEASDAFKHLARQTNAGRGSAEQIDIDETINSMRHAYKQSPQGTQPTADWEKD